MGRAIILVLVAVVLIGVLAVESGSVPRASEMIERLASRPEVGDRFEDPDRGRFDATVFLFTSVLGAPLVLFALGLAYFVVHLALEATVMPLGRRLGMPDAFVVAMVMMALVAVAYAKTELWLPRSLDLLGLIARAWVVSTT